MILDGVRFCVRGRWLVAQALFAALFILTAWPGISPQGWFSVKAAAPANARPAVITGADNLTSADLVLINGSIYTGDTKSPRVRALAIRGEMIVAAGSNAEVKRYAGPQTRVMDLHGQFVMPGFNDAHVHIGEAARAKLQINLEGARSLVEFQQRIRGALKSNPPGAWMTGFGWDHTLWPGKRFPNRADLDAVATDRPMLFERVDGHVAVANSLALKLAGITMQTPDPPAGHIIRERLSGDTEPRGTFGEPDGMLEEDSAMDMVKRRISPLTPIKRRRGIETALREAAQFGVTSIQDNSAWDDFLVYRALKTEGKLPVRITEWLPFDAPLDKLEQMRREGGVAAGSPASGDPWLRTGMLKAFLDGSLGSRTAATLAPYSDDPSTSGILRMDPRATAAMAIERDRAGFQIGFHAIGDHANRVALDIFAALQAANGPRDRRDRIEHAQVVAPADFPRFEELHIIASMQPSHETTDMRWAESRIGPERAKGAYAWNTLQSEGVRLAFGTDYPIESINPLRGIYACVTRELPEGGPSGGWEPQEKLPIADCIRHYTYDSAYAEFEEGRKGILAPGQFADLVALSQDLTRIAPHDILKTQAEWTITGGRFQYQRGQ
jgi:predicted amidohydrolase YtcJ